MALALVLASVLWPAAIVGAASAPPVPGPRAWSSAVYVLASRICHQKPERSFRFGETSWPVCARCSGLYLAAPLGGAAALLVRARRRPLIRPHLVRPGIVLAALPTAATLLAEWFRILPVGNSARAWAALPLGAAIAFAVVTALPGAAADQVH